jgi:hypothetical protein
MSCCARKIGPPRQGHNALAQLAASSPGSHRARGGPHRKVALLWQRHQEELDDLLGPLYVRRAVWVRQRREVGPPEDAEAFPNLRTIPAKCMFEQHGHHRNEDPTYGRQIGSKYPVVHSIRPCVSYSF